MKWPPNRGPRKQVFVCGVAERSGPVRQDKNALSGKGQRVLSVFIHKLRIVHSIIALVSVVL
jgi:hypothetical protein